MLFPLVSQYDFSLPLVGDSTAVLVDMAVCELRAMHVDPRVAVHVYMYDGSVIDDKLYAGMVELAKLIKSVEVLPFLLTLLAHPKRHCALSQIAIDSPYLASFYEISFL